MDKYESVISEVVFGEKQAATYRLISRKLEVHVNIAKECLWSFYDKNKDSLDITYAIAGIKHVDNAQPPVIDDLEPSEQESQPKNDPAQLEVYEIVLAGKDQLEDEKKKFQRVKSVHVYSIAEAQSMSVTLLEASNAATRKLEGEIESIERFTKLGLIRNTWIGDEELKHLRSAAIPQVKEAATKEPAEKPKGSVEPPKQEAPKQQQQQQKSSNRLAELFKNAPPKKTPEEKETTISDNHNDKHDNEDVEMEDAPRKRMTQKERQQKQAELQRMFDDDDDEEEEENAKADEDQEMADAEINLELDADKEKEKEESDKKAEESKKKEEEKPAEKKTEKKPPAAKKSSTQSKQGKKGKQTTLQSFFKKG